MYQGCLIIILDESFANVDPENKHYFQYPIRQLTRSKIIIMIVHRLKTVRDAEQIFVLEDGRIIEQGNYGQLFHFRICWNVVFLCCFPEKLRNISFFAGKTNANKHYLFAFGLVFFGIAFGPNLGKGLFFWHIHLELNQINNVICLHTHINSALVGTVFDNKL